MWYRLATFSRRPLIQEWEKGVIGQWDTAAPGKSALDAAIRRSLQAEAAGLRGEHSAAILWDFEKYFDSIDLRILVREAIR